MCFKMTYMNIIQQKCLKKLCCLLYVLRSVIKKRNLIKTVVENVIYHMLQAVYLGLLI